MTIHAILTEAEQQMIVNALSFYNDYWAADAEYDHDTMQRWALAFREDNQRRRETGPVDKLATKIATLK